MYNKIFINKALDYIKTAWQNEDISLEKVAENAGFSISYFDRMFAKATGKPVMEYVRTYKLIRSAHILRSSDRSIIDISMDLGYENPENYTRAFKAMYEISPSEYRKKHENISMQWKDNSTGTVIKRFEAAFPDLVRFDIDEFLDYLLVSDPLRFMFNNYFAKQIDCAVYMLSDENEYIYVEEFDASRIDLMLFCKEENISGYINMAKAFPKYSIGFICDKDYNVPVDKLGFAEVNEYISFDYAYLEDSIDIPILCDYSVRELCEADSQQTEIFAKEVNPVIWRVFEQKHSHGNYGDTIMFGLFNKQEMAGVCMPTLEKGRGTFCADIGGIFMKTEYENEKTVKYLWSSVINAQIKMGAVPTNGGTTSERRYIDIENTEKMGYTLIAKRYSYSTCE
jgi:AraC-like DNA-binding protein